MIVNGLASQIRKRKKEKNYVIIASKRMQITSKNVQNKEDFNGSIALQIIQMIVSWSFI